MATTHFRTCHLCEAMCGIEVTLEDGAVTAIKGDKADPLSRGHICPKARAIADIQDDPDRLRTPIRREGDRWHPIGWDEAFDLVVERLVAVRKAKGPNAIGIYSGNPNVHNYGNMTHANLFLKPLKTRNRFSASSVDQMPHQLVAYLMFGHQFLIPITDIDHTDFFLMLGANPLASNGSLMTVPDVRARLRALQKRGGKLVVIDPRRTETAALADQHLAIRPGTDAALLAALINAIAANTGSKPGRLEGMVTGLDAVLEALAPFTPEHVADFCGIPAETIGALATAFASAEKAACYGRMGISTQRFGTLCQWLVQVLNILTGNFDKRGGVLFTKPALDMLSGPMSRPGHFDAWRSRVRALPEFSGELPAATMADEIATEGEGQIRAMVTVAGNPVLSTPNGKRLEEALAGLDFMVSIDCYLNETTRFADVILPPVGPLEKDHYDLIFHIFAVRNTVKYSRPTLPKQEDGLEDWEIFSALGERLAVKLGKDYRPLPPPKVLLDMGLRAGPYGADTGHEQALDLEKVASEPHGIDLGPLEPSLPDRLFTADKKIDCAPEPLMKDLARLEEAVAETPDERLLLIGRRHLRSNNSWLHNSARLVKGPRRDQMLMHPDDLAARGLTDGAMVRVSSRVGSVEIEVAASEDIRQGVVSIPHGWGHHRKGTRTKIAEAHAGISANDLTDELLLDALSANAAINGVPVEVSRLEA